MASLDLTASETANLALLQKNFGLIAVIRLTARGLAKQDPDATTELRALLRASGVHDYDKQLPGRQFIQTVLADYIAPDCTFKVSVSFNRTPSRGDRRYRIGDASRFISGEDVLGFLAVDGHLIIVNLSKGALASAEKPEQIAAASLSQLAGLYKDIPGDFLRKLRVVARSGWHRNAVGEGSSGVGETLEKLVGIQPNTRKHADYRGIELKGASSDSWYTLFVESPHPGKSSLNRQGVVDATGSKNYDVWFNRKRENGMQLEWRKRLLVVRQNDTSVLAWDQEELWYRLLEKHSETFWVSAQKRKNDSVTEFLYETIMHTKAPRWEKFVEAVESGKLCLAIQLKHAGRPNASVRGYAFRIHRAVFFNLFGGKKKAYKLR